MAAIVQLTTQTIEALPNYRKKTAREWSSSCPVCGGKDRFLFWPEKGNYYCRRCELQGFVVDVPGADLFRVTPEMKAEFERQRLEREQEEHERHLSAIERLQESRCDQTYIQNIRLSPEFYGFIEALWGIDQPTAERFNLGYSNICPTYHQSDSITIPYYWGGKLVNLRHRLIQPSDEGKYRPEMAGLQSAIYNADRLLQDADWLVLVEGEFKTIALEQCGFPTIGIPGANSFKDNWPRIFQKVETVYVCLDPGADEQAFGICQRLGRAGVDARLVTVPTKPDDMLTIYGVTRREFSEYLRQGAKC